MAKLVGVADSDRQNPKWEPSLDVTTTPNKGRVGSTEHTGSAQARPVGVDTSPWQPGQAPEDSDDPQARRGKKFDPGG